MSVDFTFVMMVDIKVLSLFAIIIQLIYCENIFYEKLNNLLDYALVHDAVDSGVVLGIYFAKGQLLSDVAKPEVLRLFSKCEKLEKKMWKEEDFASADNEIGEYFDFFFIFYLIIFLHSHKSHLGNTESSEKPAVSIRTTFSITH